METDLNYYIQFALYILLFKNFLNMENLMPQVLELE